MPVISKGSKGFAFDASARSYDANGHLTIARSHISKACVNPYYGHEIPNAEMLGLDLNKVYYLLRSPEELAKGAHTFAMKPILSKHIPIKDFDTLEEQQKKQYIVGAIGSDVEFLAPYLDADTSIWDITAIAGIETETVREFSCSYRYVAVMTPGIYEGVKYDGVMTEIEANHLALVEAGRAGSDVLAADQILRGVTEMKKTKFGKSLVVVLGKSFPKLAADAAFLPALVGGATLKTIDKAAVKAAILAHDAETAPADVDEVMDAMCDVDPEAKEPKGKDSKECSADDEDEEESEEEKKKKAAKDKSAKDKAAKDAEEKDEREKDTKKAMDAFRADLKAAEVAKADVRSIVGDVIAQDSAADIYAFALDHMKIDHAGVTDPAALRAIFNAGKNARATTQPVRVAADAAQVGSLFGESFNRIRVM
jgi:uncharacterized protein